MATKGIEMGLVLVLVAILWGGATAQSSCNNVLSSLAPCLNYVTGNSSTPSSSCCSQLDNVVKSQPKCLCTALNGGASLGLSINQTLALGLPGVCNVQTPPLSQCNAANGPTPSAISPVSSPAGSSNGTPETPITNPGAGSKTVPSTNGNTSDGGITKSPLHFIVFLLFLVSFVSTGAGF